ncbi:hypothetical protein [Nostoc sp.]
MRTTSTWVMQILQASRLVEAENLRRQLLRIPAIYGWGGCQLVDIERAAYYS